MKQADDLLKMAAEVKALARVKAQQSKHQASASSSKREPVRWVLADALTHPPSSDPEPPPTPPKARAQRAEPECSSIPAHPPPEAVPVAGAPPDDAISSCEVSPDTQTPTGGRREVCPPVPARSPSESRESLEASQRRSARRPSREGPHAAALRLASATEPLHQRRRTEGMPSLSPIACSSEMGRAETYVQRTRRLEATGDADSWGRVSCGHISIPTSSSDLGMPQTYLERSPRSPRGSVGSSPVVSPRPVSTPQARNKLVERVKDM